MEYYQDVPLNVDDEFIKGMTLAYVPEADDDIGFWDILTIATERDIRAANELLWSVLYG